MEDLTHHYRRCRLLTVSDLPDDVLLNIFDFYVSGHEYLELIHFSVNCISSCSMKGEIESWQPLVHVCRRWRCLVFGSPRRLNLQLCYYNKCDRFASFTAKTRNAGPPLPFPINIRGGVTEELVDIVIPRLKHQICRINLNLVFNTIPQIEKLWTAMQVPFSELVCLDLTSHKSSCAPVIPDSFLSGSAPRLRRFVLIAIGFPGLPKLLLSATNLVYLYLLDIPGSGYITPETTVTCLSTLTRLESLSLHFHFESYPDLKHRHHSPPTLSVIPALKSFSFKGENKYLEEVLARIDVPQLRLLSTTSFYDIDFKVPELDQFLSRTPSLGPYDEARFVLNGHKLQFILRGSSEYGTVYVEIQPNWQLSVLAQVYALSWNLRFSTMENLCVCEDFIIELHSEFLWNHIEDTEWLDLLRPFTTVKNLYLSKRVSLRIAIALQDLTREGITELLPALQNVLLEGFQPSEPVQEGIARFISVRQLTNHPVAISAWNKYSHRN